MKPDKTASVAALTLFFSSGGVLCRGGFFVRVKDVGVG